MDEKIYNPASYNDKAPQPGMAAVDTDNTEERDDGQDKRQPAFAEKGMEHGERNAGEEAPGKRDSSA